MKNYISDNAILAADFTLGQITDFQMSKTERESAWMDDKKELEIPEGATGLQIVLAWRTHVHKYKV